MTNFEKLRGRKLDVNYETGFHFEMTYLSDKKLKWKALYEVEEGEATEGVEPFYSYEISDGIYNINWIEQEGMTVSQILDFNTGKVYAFLTWSDDDQRGGRNQLFQKGTFQFID